MKNTFNVMPPAHFCRFMKTNTDKLVYQFEYVLPYERFDGIRALQLAIHRHPEKGPGIIIDLSQWVEHEKEEYFTVFMQFLHDFRTGYDYTFVVPDVDERIAYEMFKAVKTYVPCDYVHPSDDDNKAISVRALVEEQGFEREAAELLYDLLKEQYVEKCCDMGLFAVIGEEARALCRRKTIGVDDLRMCLENPIFVLRVLTDITAEMLTEKYDKKKEATYDGLQR